MLFEALIDRHYIGSLEFTVFDGVNVMFYESAENAWLDSWRSNTDPDERTSSDQLTDLHTRN